MIKIGTFLQDRYLIGKQIGEGGMGAVYEAIDQRFESRVAIKETFYNHDELSEAFEREARLLNSLHHPVLPHVSDFFTEDDKHFLVMEFIEGEDLSEIMKNGGRFEPADVLRWANQLLDALDYLHSQNPPIIHRDIKPQNLKITTRGDVILLDFGLAKLETADHQGVRSVFGYSRTYSPLEQIEGTGTDVRSDIFSLAATGYHLLTGRPPIDALKRASAIVSGKPDPLEPASVYNSELNPALVHILQTALALNPDERYSSATAMRTAIEHALNDDSPAVTENSNSQPAGAIAENVAVSTTIESDFPALAAFANDPEHNPAARIAEQSANNLLLPDPETHLTLPTLAQRVSSGKFPRLIAALLIMILSAGLIIWFSGSQNVSPVAASQDSAVQAAAPVENTASSENETSKVEPVTEPNLQKEIADPAVLPLPKKPALKALEPEKDEFSPTTIKRSTPNSTASIESKPSSQPKPARAAQPKPVEKITRPRVVPDSAPATRRESSAAEIRRFLIGEPLSREERRRRRQERRRALEN